jgi:ribonuclease HII
MGLVSYAALIAGVDEVGRGPLAGPVVTAAVILDPRDIPDGLADSKRLMRARREALFPVIMTRALAVSLASAGPEEIDRLNIRAATLAAMARAVAALAIRPARVLVDGRDRIATLHPCEAIIGGDASVPAIAAASIVAKVTRDRLMARLDRAAPAYGFARHAGYGVPAHLAAIEAHGPSPHHRFSFAPIKGRWARS